MIHIYERLEVGQGWEISGRWGDGGDGVLFKNSYDAKRR